MTPAPETPTYYDQWGPVARRVLLAGHYCRFLAKTSFGLGPRILVEINWRLGDEIMALPIYEALKKRHPAAQVDVLCNYPELLDDNPYVDAVNPSEPSVDRYYLLRGAPRDAYRLEHYARQADVDVPNARPTLYYKNWDSPLLDELAPGEGPVVAIAAVGIFCPHTEALRGAFSVEHGALRINLDGHDFRNGAGVLRSARFEPAQQRFGIRSIDVESLSAGVRHRAGRFFHQQAFERHGQIDAAAADFAS